MCGHPGALYSSHISAVPSLRTAAQIWHTDILVPCAASTSAVGLPDVIRTWRPKRIVPRGRLAAHCGTGLAYGHPGALHNIDIRDGLAIRFSKMAPARGHPRRSLRFALRTRPGVRTSGCPAHHPHAQWVCPTVGHEPARDHPPRSLRFALRCRPGIRTSWCPAQHLNAHWACHTLSEHGAPNGSSPAVASLRTTAQTWHTDILVLFTASTSAMGLPYGFQKWRPRGIIRRGRFASHCAPDLAYGPTGALHNI
jgi:hypothetical protein